MYKNDDNKATEFESQGLIMGLDEALCACCGNWLILIEGEQNIDQFLELPHNSEIDLNTAVFPISVSLSWKESNSDCDFIIITEIIEN
jgi:hypothetical protein